MNMRLRKKNGAQPVHTVTVRYALVDFLYAYVSVYIVSKHRHYFSHFTDQKEEDATPNYDSTDDIYLHQERLYLQGVCAPFTRCTVINF